MKVLVTGATGFAGNHLARVLVAGGCHVRALVRPENAGAASRTPESKPSKASSRTRRNGQASRSRRLRTHLPFGVRSAVSPIRTSRAADVNVGGTLNILAAAREHGCECVVHCSTGGVHGHIERPPADETYRFRPGDIYQRTKLEAELAATAAAERGQPIAIVRPGAIYGEGDLRFLPLFRVIQRRRFAMVGSGWSGLHMVHVDDLVSGIMLAGARGPKRVARHS